MGLTVKLNNNCTVETTQNLQQKFLRSQKLLHARSLTLYKVLQRPFHFNKIQSKLRRRFTSYSVKIRIMQTVKHEVASKVK